MSSGSENGSPRAGGEGRKALPPVQGRFEGWLWSHGYRPAWELSTREITEAGGRVTDHAGALLRDYLADHPEDEPSRPELAGHAAAIGNVWRPWDKEDEEADTEVCE